jgi:hypothetical protein
MRGVTVELPEAARAKLSDIEAQRCIAEDLLRGCAQRINSLPREAVELRERLVVERDKHAERHRVLSMLVSRVNQFCVELRGNVALECAPAVEIKLKASETVVAALAATRAQIAGVQRELAAVRKAPLCRSSQEEAIRAHLARLVQRPKIGFDARGGALVTWVEDMATMDGVLGLLAFVLPEQVSAAFAHDLEPESPGAVSPLEREKRISELSVSLLALERTEEALIERAASEGIELARRGDASPVAVLGVLSSMGMRGRRRRWRDMVSAPTVLQAHGRGSSRRFLISFAASEVHRLVTSDRNNHRHPRRDFSEGRTIGGVLFATTAAGRVVATRFRRGPAHLGGAAGYVLLFPPAVFVHGRRGLELNEPPN